MVTAQALIQPHDGNPLPGEDAWCGLRQTYLAVSHGLDLELRTSHRLPLGEFDLLRALSQPGCAQRMSGLAGAVGLSPSGLTRAIERLEARGLVDRVTCQDDRRGAMVMLTAAGETLLREASVTHATALRRLLLDHLSEVEAAQLVQLWRRVLDHEIGECSLDGETAAHHSCESGVAALPRTTDPEGHTRAHD